MKILKAKFIEKSGSALSYEIGKDDFIMYCGSNALEAIEIQLEGKPAVKAIDFIRGYRGDKIGRFEN